jgi:hypothetical protein
LGEKKQLILIQRMTQKEVLDMGLRLLTYWQVGNLILLVGNEVRQDGTGCCTLILFILNKRTLGRLEDVGID